MACNLVVPHPLSCNRLHVWRRIEWITICILNAERVDLRTHRDTVGIVCLHLYKMLTCIAETEADAVCSICILLIYILVDLDVTKDPHRHHARVVHGEGNIVCRLIHRNGHIKVIC